MDRPTLPPPEPDGPTNAAHRGVDRQADLTPVDHRDGDALILPERLSQAFLQSAGEVRIPLGNRLGRVEALEIGVRPGIPSVFSNNDIGIAQPIGAAVECVQSAYVVPLPQNPGLTAFVVVFEDLGEVKAELEILRELSERLSDTRVDGEPFTAFSHQLTAPNGPPIRFGIRLAPRIV